ncbi:MAG: hypothetical protein PHQ40_03405 [Anaerolineaceae bacterium]|nr:hypothetical protein [Anaerolineaceae bacterium]
METSNELQQAIDYAREGNRPVASRLLARYVTQDPQNDTAWLWLAACLDDSEKQRYCLKKANEINPNNPNTIESLSSFLAKPKDRPARRERPVAPEAIAMPAPVIPVTPEPAQVRSSEPEATIKPATKRGLTRAQTTILVVLILAILAVVGVLAYLVLFADPNILSSLFQTFTGQ